MQTRHVSYVVHLGKSGISEIAWLAIDAAAACTLSGHLSKETTHFLFLAVTVCITVHVHVISIVWVLESLQRQVHLLVVTHVRHVDAAAEIRLGRPACV